MEYWMNKLRSCWEQEESGVGTVEIVLILVVLIALVVIFRDQITSMLNGIFTNMNSTVNSL